MADSDVQQILKSISDLSARVEELRDNNIRAESKYLECRDKNDLRYVQICNFKQYFYKAMVAVKAETRSGWRYTLTIMQIGHVAVTIILLLRLI